MCGAVRQGKALSFLGQVVPHRIKRSIRMWIPDAERLKISAAEVEGGEGHLSCVKNALMNHEKALYRERLTCYDAMHAAHEEKQESKLQSGQGQDMRHPHGLRFRWRTVPQSPPRW